MRALRDFLAGHFRWYAYRLEDGRWYGHFKRRLPDREADCMCVRKGHAPGRDMIDTSRICRMCDGSLRVMEREREVDLLEVGIERSTRTYGLEVAAVVNCSEDDLKTTLMVPPIGSFYTRWKFGPLGLSWKSVNPLRLLFLRGKPDHVGGKGLRYGPLGGESRKFGVSASHGRVRLHIASNDHGSTRERRLPWRMRLRMNARPFHGEDKAAYEALQAEAREWLKSRGRYTKRFRPEHGWEPALHLDPRDRLLGARAVLRDTVLEDALPAVVPMPEGNYPCKVTLTERTVGRPRWPWSRETFISSEVELDVPVPVPGKGENSYDLDDDAIYSQGASASTIGDAVAKVAASALSSRERHAGAGWTPDAGWPAGLIAR